jgi:hypothetical protein
MDEKPTARIEFRDADSVDDVDLDDEVTLMVKGKVKSLRGPDRHKTDGPKGRSRNVTFPGCMELENCEFKVVKTTEWDKATEAMEDD